MSRIWLAFAAAIALGGCASKVATGLRTAAEARSVPEGLVVVYDDREGPWGGDRVEVRSDGLVRWWRARPGFVAAARAPERALAARAGEDEPGAPDGEGRVPPEALLRLVDLLVEVEGWEQRAPEAPDRLQASRARLVLRLGGERREVWEYAEDLPTQDRLARVREALMQLASSAE